MENNIILYGAGKIGREAALLLKEKNIKCYIDASDEIHNKIINGIKVYHVDEVDLTSDSIVYISTIKDTAQIINELLCRGVKRENIVLYDLYKVRYLANEYKKLNEITDIKVEKTKVIFGCYSGLQLGGIEEWTKQIVYQLAKKNYETGIIYSGEKVSTKSNYFYVDVKERCLIGSIWRIIDKLVEIKPEIIVTSQVDDILRAACSVKLIVPDTKIICVIHGGIKTNYERYPLYNEYVDVYIGVSNDICEELAKRGIDKTKIYHMTCPVKLMDKNAIRTYSIDRNKPIRIGYAGRLEVDQKRMDVLLQLIFELEKNKVNYCMHIAGDGLYKNHMEYVVNKSGLDSKVYFLGQIGRDEIPDFWQNNDICVNVADYEGRSISIMEAMANGTVPIVTQTSGVKEDIQNDINGYYVELGNYKKIARYITYLEKNREELSRLGSKAKAIMEEKCNIDNHVDFWCNLLNRVTR